VPAYAIEALSKARDHCVGKFEPRDIEQLNLLGIFTDGAAKLKRFLNRLLGMNAWLAEQFVAVRLDV